MHVSCCPIDSMFGALFAQVINIRFLAFPQELPLSRRIKLLCLGVVLWMLITAFLFPLSFTLINLLLILGYMLITIALYTSCKLVTSPLFTLYVLSFSYLYHSLSNLLELSSLNTPGSSLCNWHI